MRPGQNKRMRGRPNNNNGGGNRKGPNPLTRSYESNGPDVKIRGNAHHVAEKYLQLARDAQSSGDPVAAESYLQHAEHYFRLIASAQAAQAGFSRQPDAVDTEGEGEDDDGLPDRFASPQVATPFVAQAPTQPYGGDRQSFGNDRQPYGDRQNNGGDRQPYTNDRQQNGERPPYGDRNAYQQRQDRNGQDRNGQDRNGLNRRPYRDNAGGEIRTDDRQDRSSQDRVQQDRSSQDRGQQDRSGQERPFQDRQSRRERFAQDRAERNGQDRGYDRQDRGQGGDRFRDASSGDGQRDPYAGDQPRTDQATDQTAAPAPQAPAEQIVPIGFSAQPDMTAQPVARAEPAPRREPRQERQAAPVADEAPGLPSFITTPTRVAPVEPVQAPATAEPNLATATAFPGDGAEEAPKFPRRRRRTTRTAVGDAKDASDGEAPAEPASTGD